jgi:lipocalin
MNKKRNQQLADGIKDFLIAYELNYDTRIYFNNKCYDFDSQGNIKIIDGIKGSDYFEYANDETVSMSFEGPLYMALNYGPVNIERKFSEVFNKHGMYYELGNTWNLAAFEV